MSRSRPSDSFPPPSPPSSPPSSPSAALPPPSPPAPAEHVFVGRNGLNEQEQYDFDNLEVQVLAMAALWDKCRLDAQTVVYSVPPEYGMYGAIGELADGDWARARRIQYAGVRALSGLMSARMELEEFQEYHRMEVTAQSMGTDWIAAPSAANSGLLGAPAPPHP